jgi:UDP-glucose 4-epimerase
MAILVTGGAGYIGSHTCVSLIEAGYEVVIMDNLSNSSKEVIDNLEKIVGKPIPFYNADLRNKKSIQDLFRKEKIHAVIHFAGLKAVGESVQNPILYYENNLVSTLVLLEVMAEFGIKDLVFSSSATVYGKPASVPITEDFPLAATNPYGATKLMIEQILTDLYKADPTMNISILRYFNPAGAHKSGLIGENPRGLPNNLFPFITLVAAGKQQRLNVYGNDYNTKDGTGVRDYIHVMDLAEGHVAALEHLSKQRGFSVFNLGTGKGYSVLDIIHAFEEANGIHIPYAFVDRRPGDIDECYANSDKAFRHLKWRTTRTLEDMCKDSWMFEFKRFKDSENI